MNGFGFYTVIVPKSCLRMTDPLNSLQKGLQILQNDVRARKSRIEADLRAKKTITESDEEWIDGAGNLVDEERVVEELEKASDYEYIHSRILLSTPLDPHLFPHK